MIKNNIWYMYYRPLAQQTHRFDMILQIFFYLGILQTLFVAEQSVFGSVLILKALLLSYCLLRWYLYGLEKLKKEVLYLFSLNQAALRRQHLIYAISLHWKILLCTWIIAPLSIPFDLLLFLLFLALAVYVKK